MRVAAAAAASGLAAGILAKRFGQLPGHSSPSFQEGPEFKRRRTHGRLRSRVQYGMHR
jgi:hypothetical protein